MRRALRSLGLVAVLAIVGACEDAPTEIFLTIDGPKGFGAIAVEVDAVEQTRRDLSLPNGLDLPLTLALVHGGGSGLGPFRVAAVAYSKEGDVVARRCEPLTFLPEETIEAELTLVTGTIEDCPSTPDGGPEDAGAGDASMDAAVDAGPSCDPVACAMTPGAQCIDERCTMTTCTLPWADCAGIADCETNTNSSEAHCGGCDMPCASDKTCMGGTCL